MKITDKQYEFVCKLGMEKLGMSLAEIEELIEREYNCNVLDLDRSKASELIEDLIRWNVNPYGASE